MGTPAGVYPFSTQDGKAIPLDIIKPTGVLRKTFTSAGDDMLVVPDGTEVATIHADADCVVGFDGSVGVLVDGVVLPNSLYVPAGSIITVALDSGPIAVRGISGSGTLTLQTIDKWAGLALSLQYNRK